ncbi:DUF4314 domain-containing protein [Erysipelotrichaceae bacterium HCN-30851]
MKQNEIVNELRKKYPKGTRIKCVLMKDKYNPVPSGTIGSVRNIDDAGTIHMAWENGSSLGLVVDEDIFEVIAEDIKVDDVIACNGQKIKVATILTQDSYIFLEEEIHDIEFRDEQGNYHHWKSNIDGGYIIRK